MDTFIRSEKQGRVALVTLDRPPVNALTLEMVGQLGLALEAAAGDPEVCVIVLAGAGGRAFAAGADIRAMAGLDRSSGRALARAGHETLGRIAGLAQPVLCAVEGACLGGGCEIALACDIRIAAEGSRIGLPEVSLGTIPGWGGTQRLPRLIGRSAALRLLLTAEPVDAHEALRVGLVDRVVPAGQALETTMEMARRIAGFGRLAVQAAKRCALEGLGTTLEEGLRLEVEAFAGLCDTEDMQEGLRAFLEKRKAAFKDR
jgi:enoyl-CoA hydratase/carnithine racemase